MDGLYDERIQEVTMYCQYKKKRYKDFLVVLAFLAVIILAVYNTIELHKQRERQLKHILSASAF